MMLQHYTYIWLGLGTKSTLLGLGKDLGLD